MVLAQTPDSFVGGLTMSRFILMAAGCLALAGCGYQIGGPPSSPRGFTATHASIGNPSGPVPELPAPLREQLAEQRR
jgi:hypothetical protein